MPQRAPTVFGRGPEIHLLPNIGRVGTRVLAVGLGYPPGAQVSLWYGAPNAEFMPRPIASAGVSSRGIFRTSFTVTCAFVVLNTTQALHPPNRCPLSPAYRVVVVGGFVGHSFTHKQTAVEGFFVTG